jgi:hypothetical protein
VTGWSIAALTLAMVTLFCAVDANGGGSVAGAVVAVVSLTSLAVVGAVVVSRFPRHRLGWLLLVVSAAFAIGSGAGAYVDLREPDDPLWTAAAIVTDVCWIAGLGSLVVFLGLLIPDGRLPSRRWRPVAAFGAAALAVNVVATLLRTDLGYGGEASPIGVGWAGTLQTIGTWCLPPVIGAALSATVVRYRRSTGTERLQLKWIAAGFLGVVGISVADGLLSNYLLDGYTGMPQLVQFSLWLVVPATFAIAILRYRLYDIDVLIRRTLVYATLVLTLGAVYLAAIAALGAASRALTGQSGTLAVTLSTLLVAAAFQPLRSRIQRSVDHRFYRARYDAARTLESFAGRLRDEVDLDEVGAEIAGVVVATLRPAHVTLWLRAGEAPR